jgi:multicomponent K+:H+ antiporter subunit F
MSEAFLHAALVASQVLLGAGMLLCAWRIWRGPSAEDRVLGLDTLYVIAMLLMLTFGLRASTTLYLEAALVIALLGFVATVALAKFLLRGEVIE